MTTSEFLTVIGLIESHNNPNVALGDGGRALGRYQFHLCRLFDEANRYHLYPTVGETVDSFLTRVLTAIYEHRKTEGYSDIEIALFFHLGHFGSWDDKYACEFQDYSPQQEFEGEVYPAQVREALARREE